MKTLFQKCLSGFLKLPFLPVLTSSVKKQIDGNTLNEEMALFVLLARKETQDLHKARKGFEVVSRIFSEEERFQGEIRDFMIEGEFPLKARFYRPNSNQNLPILLYFHGGGFTFGGIESHDLFCRALAEKTGISVIAIDYRLSPEHPFPTPLEDVWRSYLYVRKHVADFQGNPEEILVGGDSAGACLALSLTYRAKRLGVTFPKALLLLYPALDPFQKEASHTTFQEGYLLSTRRMKLFWDNYLPKEIDREDPEVSPYLMGDFSGFPDTFILVSGFDPLRDEGLKLADKMDKRGVKVETVFAKSMPHYFIPFGGVVKEARDETKKIYEFIKKLLKSPRI